MYNMIQKRKSEIAKNKKKGFTLVEVIVVLVILAILAAILIPSMIGWINKAQKKSSIVEARSVLLAAQTISSENYKTADSDIQTAIVSAAPGTADMGKDMWTLAEIDSGASVTAATVLNHKITSITYKSTDGYTTTYTKAGGWSDPTK